MRNVLTWIDYRSSKFSLLIRKDNECLFSVKGPYTCGEYHRWMHRTCTQHMSFLNYIRHVIRSTYTFCFFVCSIHMIHNEQYFNNKNCVEHSCFWALIKLIYFHSFFFLLYSSSFVFQERITEFIHARQ